jgi:pimeloyl-ACP methyl ester carboxylesterase
MQADVLAALLTHLGLAPAVITGGSGGSRVSLLAAARHPEVARALAVWWISGGPYGLLTLGTHYCGDSIAAAWRYGMEAVADLPEWAEVLERNPVNRAKLLAQEPKAFIHTLEQWMLAYCPRDDELVPGLPDAAARSMDLPALVFRSGESDPHHTRATSERLAQLLPHAELVEPPWGDREWNERVEQAASGVGIFSRWPLLADQLVQWSGGL